MDATVAADKRFAQLEERCPGLAGSRFVDIGVSGFRLLVPGVVRARTADVGGGAGKGIYFPVCIGWMDIRDGVFLRDVLVADICANHLRRFSADSRVSVVLLRGRRCGAVSGDVRGRAVGIAAKVRFGRDASCSVCVGGNGVFAVLGDGE